MSDQPVPTSHFNLSSLLQRHADSRPQRDALRWFQPGARGGVWKSMNYAELETGANRLAWGLSSAGIQSGDRVLMMIRPGPELLKATFALFRMGAVPVFIDPGMGIVRMASCVREVAPHALIGIPRAHLFRRLFPAHFSSVKSGIWAGPAPSIPHSLRYLEQTAGDAPYPPAEVADSQPAAIFFTSGSTGVPKGVCYGHRQMDAQARAMRELYRIGADEIDLPTFPLFVLFSVHFGITAVVPVMDPARPGKADPRRLVSALQHHRVTHSFGSPALWRRVACYCRRHRIRLPFLKRILVAGAPVPWQLVQELKALLPNGEVFTPYGATEALPVSSIAGTEILADTAPQTRAGQGICVGRPAPGVTVRIIPVRNRPIDRWSEDLVLPAGEIGDITVRGECVSPAYWNRPHETRLAKIPDPPANAWHRIGDAGYLDERGRLWYCGRTRHRVCTPEGVYYSVNVEEIFNTLDGVRRSALVGITTLEGTRLALCIQLEAGHRPGRAWRARLREVAERHRIPVRHFLFRRRFPVDRRHNAKIEREALARWAARKLNATGS